MGGTFRFAFFLEMKMIHRKALEKTLAIVFGMIIFCGNALACPLCKSTIETSAESQSISQTMNLAILALLIPPVIVFGVIFFAAYKSNKEAE